MAKRRTQRRSPTDAAEPEIISPRPAHELAVHIDGDYLRSVAGIVRKAACETLLPDVLDTLVYAAQGGQLEAFIALPVFHKALDGHSVAEAICHGLIGRGIAARPAQKEVAVSYGFGESRIEKGIEVSWRVRA